MPHTAWIRLWPLAVASVLHLASTAPAAQTLHRYYAGDRAQAMVLQADEWAEFDGHAPAPGASTPSASANKRLVAVHRADRARGAALSASGLMSPVFREGTTGAGARMALPGGVVVELDPTWDAVQAQQWLNTHGQSAAAQRLPVRGQWWLLDSAPGWAALQWANALHESGGVRSATPNWWREKTMR